MTQQKQPVLSIIIVTYNSLDEIPTCLDSIRRQNIPMEVFVVDNASTDGTQQWLKEYARQWPALNLILNTENYGLAYANNQPMHQCRGDYVVIMNPDTVVHGSAFKILADYLDKHPDVGIVGPKNVYEDGTPARNYFIRDWTPLDIIMWRILRRWLPSFVYTRDLKKETEVATISGSCLMIRRSLFLEIGGYDEFFFLAIEDVVDLCLRVRQHGYRVVLLPNAVVTHLEGKSRESLAFRYMPVHRACQADIYYFQKHKGKVQAALVRLILVSQYASYGLVNGILEILFPWRFHGKAKAQLKLAKQIAVEKYP